MSENLLQTWKQVREHSFFFLFNAMLDMTFIVWAIYNSERQRLIQIFLPSRETNNFSLVEQVMSIGYSPIWYLNKQFSYNFFFKLLIIPNFSNTLLLILKSWLLPHCSFLERSTSKDWEDGVPLAQAGGIHMHILNTKASTWAPRLSWLQHLLASSPACSCCLSSDLGFINTHETFVQRLWDNPLLGCCLCWNLSRCSFMWEIGIPGN